MSVTTIPMPSSDYRGVARIGYGVIIFTFVGVFGWASIAPLSSAVVGQGVIASEGSRKTIQHLEGGLVNQILVHEGDHVQRGQVLLVLDPTQANASVAIAQTERLTLQAQEARLLAQRDSLATMAAPVVTLSNGMRGEISAPGLNSVVEDQKRQFNEQRATIDGEVDLMKTQEAEYQSQIDGVDRQQDALKSQMSYIDDELTGLKSLFDKGLVPKPRILALERERAELTGNVGRLMGDRSRALQGISETRLKIRQIRQQSFEEASKDIADVRSKLSEADAREVVATDLQKRVKIVAPVTGVVQNLRVFTEGAVVRAGEPLMDIAPDGGALMIQARFSPADVVYAKNGASTQVRLPAFHSRQMPILKGLIHSVSKDRLVDEDGKSPYFLSIVEVDPKQIPKALRDSLTAGMPAQVVVPTGSRTVMQYMLEPLTDALATTMREK